MTQYQSAFGWWWEEQKWQKEKRIGRILWMWMGSAGWGWIRSDPVHREIYSVFCNNLHGGNGDVEPIHFTVHLKLIQLGESTILQHLFFLSDSSEGKPWQCADSWCEEMILWLRRPPAGGRSWAQPPSREVMGWGKRLPTGQASRTELVLLGSGIRWNPGCCGRGETIHGRKQEMVLFLPQRCTRRHKSSIHI